MSEPQRYRSTLTTVFTMIGVAVGLGNVWRFPYMMGSYGGSAFLFIYLVFTIFFAIPALMAELSLGRHTRSSTVPAFTQALGKTWGRRVGLLLLLSVFIAGSYYAVVVGNVVFTAAFSMFSGFTEASMPVYEGRLGQGWLQFGVAALVILAATFVILRGLRRGIEFISKFFVPIFLVTIVYLIIYVLRLPGASEQLLAFLKPDFSQLNPTNTFAALGQAFYSVGLGGTFIVAYGCYLKEKESIQRIGLMTGIGDVGASLLVSLFLVPAILVFGLDMAAGPGLIFQTLPELFGQMPAGRFVGTLFLTVLTLVAFLSLVAAYEVVAGSLTAILPFQRKRIVIGIAILQIGLALPSSLYPDLIGILDLVFGSGMQVLGGVLATVGLTWGLGKVITTQQVFPRADQRLIQRVGYFWLKWAIPAMLIIVLVGYIVTAL